MTIEYSTAHKSIGRTVDFAIIMGLKSGRLGFPCQIEDDPLLDLVQAKKEHFPHAEERRLFYVAVTRARKHVYLIADDQFNISPFITEIEKEGYEIITAEQKYETIKCPVCRTGNTVRKEENGRYECTNSPYCARICPRCDDGYLVVRQDEIGRLFYGCSNFASKGCGYTEDTFAEEKAKSHEKDWG